MSDWEITYDVTGVSCPECAFTMDSCHTDNDGESYSCPCCAEIALKAEVARLTEERDALQERLNGAFGAAQSAMAELRAQTNTANTYRRAWEDDSKQVVALRSKVASLTEERDAAFDALAQCGTQFASAKWPHADCEPSPSQEVGAFCRHGLMPLRGFTQGKYREPYLIDGRDKSGTIDTGSGRRIESVAALRSRLSEATELVCQLNDALSSEWPGIADRLDGTDLQGTPRPLSEAWELSRAALLAARAFLSEVTE